MFISYISIFGIKTNKFNELIRSQIVKQDERINIELKDVFIKLNIKEKSFSVNAQNVELYLQKEKQKIANIDILIGLISLIKGENKLKKIIVNSKENEITDLLRFIRVYKINIPVLYLENSITEGNIIYNIIINFDDKNLNQIEINGKIINAELNIFGKNKFQNINLNFDYKTQKLKFTDLKFNHKGIAFVSQKIVTNLNNRLINIKGDFKNKINSNLISGLIGYDFKNYIEDKILLTSNSNFELILNKKFKIKNYNLESKINFANLDINLNKIDLKKFIPSFNNKIILEDGKMILNITKKNKIKIKINSKYTFSKKQKPKKISFNYSSQKSIKKYEFSVDLSEHQIILDELNFVKNLNETMFLNLVISKNKNMYIINNLKLFNDNNNFEIKNLKINENFKVTNFDKIEAEYFNKNEFLNNFSIKKNNDKINFISESFDISSHIEKSLKGTKKNNFFDIFANLNSSLEINIKLAKLDNEHNFNNLKGTARIRSNKIDKANFYARFDDQNVFSYTKNNINGKKITTIFSDLAKPFVKKFNFIKGFEDGKLDFTSKQLSKNLSKSELRIYDFKLQDMPALTKLLSLASLQGIADLATGEGIRFNEFDMIFDDSKNLITINEIYALGPAISILMEGYVEKNKLVSLRGTLVPATTINKTIAKIPLLGEILVGEKAGEGVFGVSFKIKGPPDKLDTRVNPIKTLTPRFITRTLDKIKKSN